MRELLFILGWGEARMRRVAVAVLLLAMMILVSTPLMAESPPSIPSICDRWFCFSTNFGQWCFRIPCDIFLPCPPGEFCPGR